LKTAIWIILASLLTYVTGAGLYNTARSADRESLVGNVLLVLAVGWYMVAAWRRALRALHALRERTVIIGAQQPHCSAESE